MISLNPRRLYNMDINIAFSMINMLLRNEFSHWHSLCRYFEIEPSAASAHFLQAGIRYDAASNQLKTA